MAPEKRKATWVEVDELARKTHGSVASWQLAPLGFTEDAIRHARKTGRLHRTEWRGVYAVGRGDLTKHGRLSAALLAAGSESVLTDEHAGGLWGIWRPSSRTVHVAVPPRGGARSRKGLVVHHRALRPRDIRRHWGLRVTSPLRTVIDLARGRDDRTVERLVIEADARNVLRADTLKKEVESLDPEPGLPLLLAVLERHEFILTESELERLFVALAIAAGLGKPHTQRRLGRGRVDFWFPHLNLVVECDSLRYHRTVQQQAEDLARDQEHFRADRERVRFTHFDVAHRPDYVIETLTLRAAAPSSRAASSRRG